MKLHEMPPFPVDVHDVDIIVPGRPYLPPREKLCYGGEAVSGYLGRVYIRDFPADGSTYDNLDLASPEDFCNLTED